MVKINYPTLTLIIGLVFFSFLFVWSIFAWIEPGTGPPEGNVLAPINISSSAQNKLGDFGLGGDVGQAIYWLSNAGGTLQVNSTNPAGTRLVIGQDGAVGIGMTSPSYKLNVAGGDTNAIQGASTGASTIGVVGSGAAGVYGSGSTYGVGGTSTSGIGVYSVSDTGTALYVNLTGAGTAIASFFDNGTEVVKIADGGNVGIGTMTPAAKLDIRGNTRIGSGVAVANKVLCWRANNIIGYCSSGVDPTGGCTCNSIP